ncbi:MAG: beta-propeller fold lactonase family protein [Verrucomicrobiales bacterium]
MRFTLVCLFCLGLLLPCSGKPFRVYAPCNKSNTLWIILVRANEGGVEMTVEQKVDLGFPGRVITSHPAKPLLYVTATDGEVGRVPGAVISLSDKGTYQKHERVAFNDGACFLSLDRGNKHLLGVSYGNGRLNVYPLDDRGMPGKAVTTIDEGKREAHCVLPSPDNRNVYIPYVKGNLALLQYRYDGKTGSLTPLDPKDARPPQGTGPRHLAYHPELPMVYFTNEQGIGLSTYRRGENGQLKIEQDLNVLAPGMSKTGLSASDLLITPDGRFLFGGLRGHRQDFDRIARYRVLENGHAEFLGLTEADKIPWGLTLSPDGRFLLVAATGGATLTAYRISDTGDLKRVATLKWEPRISDLVTR